MVSTTERILSRHARSLGVVTLLVCLLGVAPLLVAGCAKAKDAEPAGGSSETTSAVNYHMSGEAVSVYVSDDIVESHRPQPWDLSTPESAVRSYLSWVSYAYRIGNSQVATPTMGAYEEVSMDSYCQYNIEKKRLLDQTLVSISFGKTSRTATATLVPAQESWTYSYLSVDKGNRVLEGPYDIKYRTTYTVAKNDQGNWVVEAVDAKPQGTVK